MNRWWISVVVIAHFGAVACLSEPVEVETPGDSQMAVEVSDFLVSPHTAEADVAQLKIDLPPEPRPWDSDPDELVQPVAEANGRVMIGLKEPESRRSLENNGIRSAISKRQFQSGLDALHAFGVRVEVVFNSIGAVSAIINPKDAPAIRRHPLVDYVEPDSRRVLDGTPMGPEMRHEAPAYFSQTTPWGVSVVRATQAWERETGSGATVMIIDSGHYQGHEDLPYLSSSHCYGGFFGCSDSSGHGTHVMGDLLARNNSLGSVGVAPGIAASDIWVWGACHSDGTCSATEIATALDSAAAWGTDVVNMSLSGDYHLGEANAAASAWGNDVFMVAAAGNNTGSVTRYPAGLSQVLGVSGVKPDSSFASSSPCSVTTVSGYGLHVDLAAPFWSYNAEPNHEYGDEDEGRCGTSQSTPHVAGVAALVRAASPSLPNYSVWDRLTETAKDLGSAGWDAYYGEGLVDAAGALGPFADIDGFVTVQPNQTCEWFARKVGGNGPFSYVWKRNGTPVGTSSSYSYAVGTSGFELWLRVTDSDGWYDDKVYYVVVSAQGQQCEAKE